MTIDLSAREARAPRRSAPRLTGAAWGALGATTVVVAWELIIRLGLVSERSLPSPFAVGAAIPRVASDPAFGAALVDTLAAWLQALGLASVAGIVVGIVIGTIRPLAAPFMVAVNALRSIPATALIPVAILVFGLGATMKIAVSFYSVFPVILINTIYGVASTEPMRIDAARSMRWSWWRRYLWLVLPSSAPSIVTGIRVASGISLVVVISAELLGASSGVGLTLARYQQALHIDMAYACITIVGLVGMAVYGVLSAVEKATIDRIRLV